MLPLISSSLAGLYDATSRATEAAQRIVKATGQASAALDADAWQSGSQAYDAAIARSGARNGGNSRLLQPSFLPPAAESDLVRSMVDLQLAAHAYKASATVMRTADDMAATLLDIRK